MPPPAPLGLTLVEGPNYFSIVYNDVPEKNNLNAENNSFFRLFLEGDILSWDRENWVLRSPYNRSEMEFLDLEYDICSQSENGLFLVPQKMSVSEGHHICDKLSGKPVSYRNEVEKG